MGDLILLKTKTNSKQTQRQPYVLQVCECGVLYVEGLHTAFLIDNLGWRIEPPPIYAICPKTVVFNL